LSPSHVVFIRPAEWEGKGVTVPEPDQETE
jgi:hypothetical protein